MCRSARSGRCRGALGGRLASVVCAVLVTGLLIGATGRAAAADTANGALVTTFGDHGTGRYDLGVSAGDVSDGVVDASGRTITVGVGQPVAAAGEPTPLAEIRLLAFDSSGRPDPAFGDGGRVVVPRAGCGGGPTLAVDGNARVLVSVVCDGVRHLWRLLAGGAFDSTFGDHGDLRLPSGSGAVIGIQPDGTILVLGAGVVAALDPSGASIPAYADAVRGSLPANSIVLTAKVGGDGSLFVITRPSDAATEIRHLDSSGHLIAGFGNGGVASYAYQSSYGDGVNARSVTVDSSGALLVYGGYSGIGGGTLRRLLPDGTFDAGFGGASGERTSCAAAGTLQLAESGSRIFAVAVNGFGVPVSATAFRTDGSIDPAVGVDPSKPSCVSIDNGGRRAAVFVPAGGAGQFEVVGAVGMWVDDRFATRIDDHGRPVPAFGDGGEARATIGVDGNDTVVPGLFAEDQQGRLVIGGAAGGEDLVLLRLGHDGTPDASFGVEGRAHVRGLSYASGMVIEADGSILIAATSGGWGVLERLRPDGSVDPAFGSGGRVDHVGGLDAANAITEVGGVVYLGGCSPCPAAASNGQERGAMVAAVDAATGAPVTALDGMSTAPLPDMRFVRTLAAVGDRLLVFGAATWTAKPADAPSSGYITIPPAYDAMGCLLLGTGTPCGDLATGPGSFAASAVAPGNVAVSGDRLVIAAVGGSIMWVDQRGSIVQHAEAPDDDPPGGSSSDVRTVAAGRDGSVVALRWGPGGTHLLAYRSDGTLARSIGDDGQLPVDLSPPHRSGWSGLVPRADGTVAVIGGVPDVFVRVISLTDSAPFAGVSIDDGTAPESSGVLLFTIHLDPPSATAGAVQVDLEPITASAADVSPTDHFGIHDVQFGAGQSEVHAGLGLALDGAAEADETVRATIVKAYPAHIDGATAVGTIVSDHDFVTITTPSLPPAVVGVAYTAQLAAINGTPPYRWRINGPDANDALPQGLRLDPATGVISGVPKMPRRGTMWIGVTDAVGLTGAAQFTVDAQLPSAPNFLSPRDGQVEVASGPITWDPVPGSQGYLLVVGTAYNGTDVANSGVLAPSTTSFSLPRFPVGKTLFATLITKKNDAWTDFQEVHFSTPGLPPPAFEYPWPDGVIQNDYRSMVWTPVPNAVAYAVTIGTKPFGTDVAQSGLIAGNWNGYVPPPLPIGPTLYGTVLVQAPDGIWTYNTVTFHALAATPGELTYPAGNQVGVDLSHPFTWIPPPAGADHYILTVGTSHFGTDVMRTGVLPPDQLQYAIPRNLPTGRWLYVTLLSQVKGAWVYSEATLRR